MSEPIEVTPAALGAIPLPALGPDTDKDGRGQAVVFAGGAVSTGAAVLTGLGVLRAGAGKLQLVATSAYAVPLAFAMPEAAILTVEGTPDGEIAATCVKNLGKQLERADAVIVGPGMMQDQEAGALAVRLLETCSATPMLIDAAAMTGLAGTADAAALLAGRAVLTPHPGEMCRLMGCEMDEVRADPLGVARRAAQSFGAVVALKSRETFIVGPDGRAWRNSGGAAGLGTCGSGDVLAGVIGGLLARGAPPLTAAVWGVYLHARAGRRLCAEVGPLGFLAREIPVQIPRLLAELDPV